MPPPDDAVRAYLREVARAFSRGDATEHTYRPFFQRLLEAADAGQGIVATNEPKRAACGAPDYLISLKPDNGTLGYVEAKDIGVSLDEAEESEQLRRYRRSLPNLLLTDYLEFRWYVEGEERGRASLGRPLGAGKLGEDEKQFPAVLALLRGFFQQTPQGISSPDELAHRMARLTHLIRDLIVDAFAEQRVLTVLNDWREAFQKTLLPELTEAEFADMFAQTLAYGLFSARIMGGAGAKFNRTEAQKHIPKTNPFLRKFFYLITGPEMEDEPFAGFVADLVQVLALTDVYELLKNFGNRTGARDPMLHFYEMFLAAYDPKLRELRGVYYTPEPVVGWLVRSVDQLLKGRFALKDGLADASRVAGPQSPHRVLILDPATGTATFLYAIIRFVRDQFVKRDDAGQWPGYVHRDLIPRLFGFELLMAPYACAHFKLGLELAARDMDELWRDQWAYEFQPDERLNIFLTNTLDDLNEKMQRTLGLAEQAIAQEAQSALEVKTTKPVLVILGNPPYSGHSANKGEWIGGLVRDYYQVDGRPLGERNPKWLQDDYVKFIRWAQWRIEQTGSGVLAFVTNHGYLDNPTFRGMRQQLMAAFDEIWLLDLHGNAKKKETAPGGGKDQNVFDIQQGVALGLFVKLPAKPGRKKKPATVRHAHLWGDRKHKYEWLNQHDLGNTQWTGLKPSSPDYFFFPQNLELKEEYEKGWKVTDMMPVSVLGFQTHRDQFAIAFDKKAIERRISEMRNGNFSEQDLKSKYDLEDNRDWKLASARAALNKSKDTDRQIIEVAYRPFDRRWCFFREELTDYPRRELRQHVQHQQNLCLNLMRQTRAQDWRHVFMTDVPATAVFLEIKDGSSIFPLYLYPNGKKADEFVVEEDEGRRPNLAGKFVSEFSAKLKLGFLPEDVRDRSKVFGPEEVFHYAYAIFHSPSFQKRYGDFLRTDFPRLPLTSNTKLYGRLLGLGKDLVDLHLLRQSGSLRVSFPAKGSNLVDEVSFVAPQGKTPGRVRINGEQWFENVPAEVWEYHVGGYQVCEKWLKDRKGRQLTIEERQTYPQIVAALAETIRIQKEIDEAIAEAGAGR